MTNADPRVPNAVSWSELPRRGAIVRLWRGVTSERVASEYLAHIERTGIPAYLRVEGNCGAQVLFRTSNGVAEFLVISFWDSWEAIRRFTASDDPSIAVYDDEDRRLLMFAEPKVSHYWIALSIESADASEIELNPFEGTT